MQFVFDADALIKLHRAGLLANCLSNFECVITEAIYDEVVTQGKAHGYEDAQSIETILSSRKRVQIAGKLEPDAGLGRGERTILSLLEELENSVVVSDDRRFLTVLSIQDSPFVTPPDVVLILARHGVLSRQQATAALEQMKPLIRNNAYWATRTSLELLGEDQHE